MDYQNTLKYLYENVPMFQQIGGKAYKEGLETTNRLDEYFGHPHQQFKTIHIGGTNGKGSCSHTIAAVLQSAGYRVGLFTSPHLVDFRERIRINGEMIPEEYVVNFVEEHRPFFEPLHPSFFELTTAMAFRYFADQQVDVAIIEVGMGGRLDCTNIIRPDLCVITNIGFDHMQYLGDTLPKIAKEKAGIIKPNTPVVIGRAAGTVKRVFTMKAKEMNAPISYVEELKKKYIIEYVPLNELTNYRNNLLKILAFQQFVSKEMEKDISPDIYIVQILSDLNPNESLRNLNELIDKRKEAYAISNFYFPNGLFYELTGSYQKENILTILQALEELEKLGYELKRSDYHSGFSNVCEMTGLRGRWQKLQNYPEVICDTGHNEDGIRCISRQLTRIHKETNRELHIVFGMVNDKDVAHILPLLPQEATYYFTKASVKRALPEKDLWEMAKKAGLKGTFYPTVVEAVQAAKKNCPPKDFIFIGGSTYIVGDLLANRDTLNLY